MGVTYTFTYLFVAPAVMLDQCQCAGSSTAGESSQQEAP